MDEHLRHWEDEIDIDDSDFSSLLNPDPPGPPKDLLLRPPLRACSQTLIPDIDNGGGRKALIPGPAGSVQAAMRRKSSADASRNPNPNRFYSDHPLTEEEEQEEEDGDFKLGPWLSALAFLGVPNGASGLGLGSRIGSIKNQMKSAADRIPQVVGIIKSCVPNGLGDLSITLKDPTGTIGASVHRKVLLECNLDGDISVGCVLVLKQVAVFRPARSACYLNVTPNNVVKLISKDSDMPHEEMMPSSKVGQSERHLTTRGNLENDALNEGRRRIHIDKMMASTKSGLDGILPRTVTTIQTQVATTQMTTKSNATTCMDINATPNVANLDCVGHDPANTGSDTIHTKDSITTMPAKTNTRTAEPKKVFTSVLVPQWTDEQLLELFADYPDEAN